jgi:DNA polymerase I-like protein with 3'-5' exonuclease and polymerase domains
MYGRSAGALAREIARQGVDIDKAGCEKIILWFSKNFSVGWNWLESNAKSAITNEYLEQPFGRRRYWSGISVMSKQDQAKAMREAKNSPMQSTVADLLAQAGRNFYAFKYKTKHGKDLDFKILLPIHDAFLFEVRKDQVEIFKKVIIMCMSTHNKVPGTEYSLQIDIEVMTRWGEKEH